MWIVRTACLVSCTTLGGMMILAAVLLILKEYHKVESVLVSLGLVGMGAVLFQARYELGRRWRPARGQPRGFDVIVAARRQP